MNETTLTSYSKDSDFSYKLRFYIGGIFIKTVIGDQWGILLNIEGFEHLQIIEHYQHIADINIEHFWLKHSFRKG